MGPSFAKQYNILFLGVFGKGKLEKIEGFVTQLACVLSVLSRGRLFCLKQWQNFVLRLRNFQTRKMPIGELRERNTNSAP
jgi:hypothetical protein